MSYPNCHAQKHYPLPLDRCLVWHRCDALGLVVLEADSAGLTGSSGLAAQVNVDTLSLGLLPLGSILLDALQEIFSGSGVSDMLDADVDALLEVSVTNLLVTVPSLDHCA